MRYRFRFILRKSMSLNLKKAVYTINKIIPNRKAFLTFDSQYKWHPLYIYIIYIYNHNVFSAMTTNCNITLMFNYCVNIISFQLTTDCNLYQKSSISCNLQSCCKRSVYILHSITNHARLYNSILTFSV